MAAQSTIFPIFLRAEYRDDGQGFARFQSDAQRAAAAAKREFQGVKAALDQALSRNRNSSGSLDLGVDELRQAAAAQQQVAIAAREVAEATRRAATANGQFDASMSRATRAAFELANAEERASRELLEQVVALEAVQRELNRTASATDLVTAANRRGTTATSNVINSARAERTAFIQLGQQLQDITVQAQMGTNAFIIMGQQLPQAAFALSGLAESANRTKRAIGNVATFLSGPWGAAIVIAIAALGPFVAKLFESEEAADSSARAQRSLAEVLNDQTSTIKEVNAALDEYNRLQERATQATITDIQARAKAIAANLQEAISIRQKAAARIADLQAASRNLRRTGDRGAFGFDAAANAEAEALQANARANDAALQKLIQASGSVRIEVATEIARINSDSAARINAGFDVLEERAKRTITNVTELSERLTFLAKARREALEADRRQGGARPSGGSTRQAIEREPERLARFAEQAGEQVLRINDRFSGQPGLIRQSIQAMRQLDAIIADTNERMASARNLTQAQRQEFERIIASARNAQQTVIKATSQPLELIRRESEQRIAIQEALADGRTDEAAALQEIFRLEQQLGSEAELRAEIQDLLAQGRTAEARQVQGVLDNYKLMRDEVRAITVDEQRRLRVLRDQQAVFNAQLDVIATVRRDLTDILSGRSTDFFGNFRQALRDFQGAQLFESIFGKAFRDIENELQKNTPQGRANQRLVDATDKASAQLDRGSSAVSDFADVVNNATDRIRNGAANDNGLLALGLGVSGFGSRVGGAAQNALQNALFAAGLGGISVNGTRPRPTEIARNSSIDLAKRISEGIGTSIAEQFRGAFGDRFAQILGDTIGGYVAGRITGGKVGGILGGLEGLTKGIEGLGGISEALGALGQGAAIGTQVAGLSKALGLGGSSTGAAIGGALGSFAGPIGTVVGAIAGNIIGGLVKATKRGSATIGNLGGELAIVGTRGNSRSRIEQSTGLAGSALDAIQNIAQQLGANVDAARGSVSIGVRNKNIRVDTSGRGITKTSRGAIDFGDDAEAAVRAAVLDLIQDGVITGLRQSEQNLLRAGDDIEAALRDVLTFRSVFDRLQELKDPLGFAITQLNREFEQLIDLFERAGASSEEFAQLEELYNLQRAQAIEDATDRVVGSLRQLLNDLTIGDSGLSLRSRRANALSQFNDLAARVAAGDTSAFDDFADISQQLLDIERQLFGSTQSYFDRLAQITALTEQAIADQTNVTSIGAANASPFEERAEINRSIDTMNADVTGWLRAINDNLIALNPASRPGTNPIGVPGGGRATTPFPALIQNF